MKNGKKKLWVKDKKEIATLKERIIKILQKEISTKKIKLS
jgi:hypothetical protein